MPLYEYECTDCGQMFEKMVRFSDAERNPQCPACKSTHTRKQISSFATKGSLSGSSSSGGCGSNPHSRFS